MLGGPTRTPLIVVLPAEIDLTNSGATAARLLRPLAGPGLVIADMTGTTFCDSSGMRMLLAARDRADANGSTLRIVVRPGGSVARMLAILGIGDELPVYPSVGDAARCLA